MIRLAIVVAGVWRVVRWGSDGEGRERRGSLDMHDPSFNVVMSLFFSQRS